MTSTPLKILVHGASGRMGRSLLGLLSGHDGFDVVAAVTGSGTHALGDLPQFRAADLATVPAFDVAVDFSLPPGFDAVLDVCRHRGAGLVSGTTGLSGAQTEAATEAGADIPVLWSANFSVGVALLSALVEQAARAIPGWDCNLVESHHVHKRDAPSGTALALGASVAAGCGNEPVYASLRAGDIVGEHLVQFTGLGERLELMHRATDRDVFARGALHAANWLAHQRPGNYSMRDCLGLQ